MRDIRDFTFGVLLCIFLVLAATLSFMVFGFISILPAAMSYGISCWLFPAADICTTGKDLHLFLGVHCIVCWLWAAPGIIWAIIESERHEKEQKEKRKKALQELKMGSKYDPNGCMDKKPLDSGYTPSSHWYDYNWSS